MSRRLLFLANGSEVCRINVLGHWAPVDLSGTGELVLQDGRWMCSPKHFSKMYAAGFARMVIDKGTVIDADAVEPADRAAALAGATAETASAARGLADAARESRWHIVACP